MRLYRNCNDNDEFPNEDREDTSNYRGSEEISYNKISQKIIRISSLYQEFNQLLSTGANMESLLNVGNEILGLRGIIRDIWGNINRYQRIDLPILALYYHYLRYIKRDIEEAELINQKYILYNYNSL